MYKASVEMKDGAQSLASMQRMLEDLSCRLSRIEETLREGAQSSEVDDGIFAFGEGLVSRRKFAYISKRNCFVRLSPRELKLLELFVDHPNEVLPRDMLLSRLWGIDYYGNTRTLDQHVSHLRRKLGSDGEYIITINRVGYSYQPQKREIK
jgi:DNA-binding response OmpR family regulator